jgi:cytochrome b6-f complex iron-sulfur subunit
MSELSAEQMPSMGRRQALSYLTGGAIAATTVAALYPVVRYFIPPSAGGGTSGVSAKDKGGTDVAADKLLAGATPNDRILTLGIDVNGGDATYVVVNEQKQVANYAINAVCTHLGCVVPWDAGAKMFKCPCHGSQYNADGSLARGPAPLPLALVKAEVKDNKILYSPWTQDDFRSSPLYSEKKPYWVK